MKYFVYGLTDPRKDDQFFYIGKGCRDRHLKHSKETAENTINRFKFAVIQLIRDSGLEPGTKIIRDDLEESQAYELEEKLILEYGRRNIESFGILTNICIGSRPPNHSGRKKSNATKEKMRQASLGRKKSPEHCKAIGIAKAGKNHPNWGKTLSDDLKEKIRQGNLGVKRSEASRYNIAVAHSVNYELTSPTGRKFQFNSVELKKFCNNMSLNYGSLRNTVYTDKHYKGWSIKRL